MSKAAVVTVRVDETLIADVFQVPDEWFDEKDQFEIEDTIHFHYSERCNLENPEMFPVRIDKYFEGLKGFEVIDITYVDQDGSTH